MRRLSHLEPALGAHTAVAIVFGTPALTIPAVQTWAWHKSETPEDIDKMWVWRPEGADSVHPSRFDALKDEEQASLGPHTPALWRRTLVSDLPSYAVHLYA